MSRNGVLVLSILSVSALMFSPGVGRAQSVGGRETTTAYRSPFATSAPESTRTFGTAHESLYRIGGFEFQPFDSGTTYADLAFGPSGAEFPPVARYTTVGGELAAMPHLPSGALVTGVDLDFCDSNPDHHVRLLVESTSFDGTGRENVGFLESADINGCGGAFLDLTSANLVIDNKRKELFFWVATDAFDGTNALAGVIVHYRLQVSPAPATASFGDVPKSFPFFRAIEALSAAGITSGCGGGNFCRIRR